jgi:hypothetical protein
MNWDDPVQRFQLAERVGLDEYNKRFTEHINASSEVFNGYRIRPVSSRFGRLYQVMDTNVAFRDKKVAVNHAMSLPTRKEVN